MIYWCVPFMSYLSAALHSCTDHCRSLTCGTLFLISLGFFNLHGHSLVKRLSHCCNKMKTIWSFCRDKVVDLETDRYKHLYRISLVLSFSKWTPPSGFICRICTHGPCLFVSCQGVNVDIAPKFISLVILHFFRASCQPLDQSEPCDDQRR